MKKEDRFQLLTSLEYLDLYKYEESLRSILDLYTDIIFRRKLKHEILNLSFERGAKICQVGENFIPMKLLGLLFVVLGESYQAEHSPESRENKYFYEASVKSK